MKNLEFKIQLKPSKEKDALAMLITYHKCFKDSGHRFIYSTGERVTVKGFDPARPGTILKRLIKIAEDAYDSLRDEGQVINNLSLKSRIDLLRSRFAVKDNELSIWDGNKAENFILSDGVDAKTLTNSLQEELQRSKPEFKKVIDGVISNGETALFGFWEAVLSGKIKTRSGKPLRKSTVRAKRQTLRLVKEFKPSASFEGMDRKFYNDFTGWLKIKTIRTKDEDGNEIKGLDENSIGTHIKELKSILHLASANELMTDQRFTYWPVTKLKNEVVTLSKEEVLKINELKLKGTNDNVRDIFILACFLGARIGDFKQFKKEALSKVAGITYFEYVAGKTGSRVKIPVHPIALKILEKRAGEFPKMISEQNFRYALKEVCAKAKLNDNVVIKIRNGNPEYLKKHEAISPHSSRRTFASSLYYGWFGKAMPASLTMRYTGHKSEASFLLYIGADSKELDKKALEYFDFKPHMEALTS